MKGKEVFDRNLVTNRLRAFSMDMPLQVLGPWWPPPCRMEVERVDAEGAAKFEFKDKDCIFHASSKMVHTGSLPFLRHGCEHVPTFVASRRPGNRQTVGRGDRKTHHHLDGRGAPGQGIRAASIRRGW